jgi:hypothetical protein
LSVALLVSTFVAELPPAPRSMFRLLSKLDVAFASLLQGRNTETGEVLPGFAGFVGRGVSGTEKVRLKSIVDRTRIHVVEALSHGVADVEDEDDSMVDIPTESEDDPDDFNMAATTDDDADTVRGATSGVREVQGDWDMHIAKVYDKILVELGDTLGGAPIGIISDP